MTPSLSPGMRIMCRDAEWLVTRVEPANRSRTEFAVHCTGTDDLVRGHDACFLTQLDTITRIDPAKTRLEPDTSGGYRKSRLFLEARLRQMPVSGLEPDPDGMGVFDPMQFQIATVRHALGQLRPRLLLADAVGLGKTIQVGMILTELIRRGRASRILVLAKKSMLTQFQSELWNRFAIPLIRLDSDGIARLRLTIPASKNPFDVHHRIIISIDTLKNIARYEHFLKSSRWDIVIIDEAHNVAGASNAERNQSYRLARLLATRTDSMLLTTATPHNGRRETFGRLISLLDPSVIPDPRMQTYSATDISRFFKMRFKEDIRSEAGDLLSDRIVIPLAQTSRAASADEETVFDLLAAMRQSAASHRLSDPTAWQESRFIAYGLYKLFLSSPDACRSTVFHRLEKLKIATPDHPEIPWLQRLLDTLTGQSLETSTRFQLLIDMLIGLNWSGTRSSPRLLLFTESRVTQDHLAAALSRRFNIPVSMKPEDQPGQPIAVIHGGFPDIHLMKTVEAFATGSSPIRLLIATDVASEGINLHHQCHHIIHYDIPWSIITLVQRNGRIDRLGQKHRPEIRYLLIHSANPGLAGDRVIFDRLVQKVEEINRLRQTGESVLRLYDSEREADWIGAEGFVRGDPGVFDRTPPDAVDEASALEALLAEACAMALQAESKSIDRPVPVSPPKPVRFFSDREFLIQGYRHLMETDSGQYLPLEISDQTIRLPAPPDLKRRLGAPGHQNGAPPGHATIPGEAWPDHDEFTLTHLPHRVSMAIDAARNDSGYWSTELLITEQHPIIQWLTERLVMQMDRGTAPVMASPHLPDGTIAFCFIGLVSSRSGAPLITDTHAIVFGGSQPDCRPMDQVLAEAQFSRLVPSGTPPDTATAGLLLPAAVAASQNRMKILRNQYGSGMAPVIEAEESRLKSWLTAHTAVIAEHAPHILSEDARAEWIRRRIDDAERMVASRNRLWREVHYETASEPSVQPVLVITGTGR